MRGHVLAVERTLIDTVIATFVDQSCERLPLFLPDRELVMLNVTHVLNCLNQAKSVYDPALPHIIDEYAFHGGRFTHDLFKIPETRMSELLCVEGRAAPEDEFKGIVEKHGLTGLRFDKIWSDE